MNVLVATDASWLVDDIVAALGDENTSFTVCSDGRAVATVVKAADKDHRTFGIGIFDLQIGSMGGMAVTMAQRLDASAGRAPEIPVLMLVDRVADVHLAKRSGADGWLIKPLDPLRLRRAVRAITAGGTFTEGLVNATDPEPIDEVEPDTDPAATAEDAGGDAQVPEPAAAAAT